ncbi:hypothetical protein GCM10023144_01470 [Pigmentiphaga soli]|uniref:WYL domain-containing protein n=1 Tax=Pigmentiphaga soli TaxID=1007095 RepID=A0ABP8GCQ2_9BURK
MIISHEQLLRAIRDRLVLDVRYDGYVRRIEPHAYGQSTAGEPILRCWQVSGGSAHGQPTGWKLMQRQGIQLSHETGSTFPGPRPGYKRRDPAMQQIYAQL